MTITACSDIIEKAQAIVRDAIDYSSTEKVSHQLQRRTCPQKKKKRKRKTWWKFIHLINMFNLDTLRCQLVYFILFWRRKETSTISDYLLEFASFFHDSWFTVEGKIISFFLFFYRIISSIWFFTHFTFLSFASLRCSPQD